jgi:hypothetical protein
VSAIDGVLATLGYTGRATPKCRAKTAARRTHPGCPSELRGLGALATSREIARSVFAMSGQDAIDRKFVSENTKRASKALRILRKRTLLGGRRPKGNGDAKRTYAR